MASGQKIAGGGSMRIAGRIYNCTTLDPSPSSESAEIVVGMGGAGGLKVNPRAPELAATVVISPGVSVSDLNATYDETIEVRCIDGRSYVYEGASCTEPITHALADGTGSITFQAVSCQERKPL